MMEQLPGNNAEQGDSSAATPAVSLGRTLREARERLGLSVADAAYQTKLAPRQIEALEADDFQKLPEMAFVRGFVRSYAKTLNLDAQPLLAILPQAKEVSAQLAPVSVEVPFSNTHLSQRQNLIWLGAALLLVVLCGAFLMWYYITPRAELEMAQVETPLQLPAKMQIIPASPVAEVNVIALPAAPAVRTSSGAEQSLAPAAKPLSLPQAQSTAVQTSALPQDSALRLTFDEDSWVEVRDKDDKILSSQVNPRGSELRLNDHEPFSLVIGHAASVHLYHRGKQVDLTPYTSSSSEVARLTLE